MKELSLHILDLAKNSVSAGASRIELCVTDNRDCNLIYISIEDNGCGMSPDFLASVTDPFTTSRTTRNVGLGIPLMKLACEQCGGTLSVTSELGKGTLLTFNLGLNHIDRAPMGDICATMTSLIGGSPEINWIYRRESIENGLSTGYTLDTNELLEVLGPDVPLDSPDVLLWIGGFMEENEEPLPKL